MTLQAAGEKALEIEREVGPSASHHELAEAFSRAAQALPETDSRREFLIWETWLHQYQLKRAGHDAPRGDELGPLFEAGNRRHPPRVRDFPAEALEYLQHRHTSAQIPSARARLADFLLVRTRDVSLAESAVAAYLDAAQAVIPGRHGVMAATEYLIRSAAISRSLGRDGADVRAAIRGLAAFLIHDGSGFLCILVRGTKAEIANDAELF